MATEDVTVNVKDQVCWITLNRPEARNALRQATTEGLEAALRSAEADPDVRCIVLTGAGPAFCAGGDVKEMAAMLMSEKRDPHLARGVVRRFHQMVRALYETEKPVIAAINGTAAGAGCNLALACDVRIASDQAKFVWAFIHRGLTSDGGSTYLLQRQVGYAKAFELLTLGDTISVQDAHTLGIVNRVAPHDSLMQETEALAARYVASPPQAVALTKRALRFAAAASLEDSLETEASLQALCFIGDEHAEGVTAFMEKREPRF